MVSNRQLDQLSWPAVQAAGSIVGSTLVLPVGAMEQHGPHLPLGTDALFAERVLQAALARLAPELPIWRLPLQSFGFSPEHEGFPGTVSLPASVVLGLPSSTVTPR
ncbi:MAG: hypothetical protein EBV59_10365 [Synechococcaceae bacterium WB7_1C_051]|nr:hypothetical protein [Synechococcaceae bacterium WB7_1C_051]